MNKKNTVHIIATGGTIDSYWNGKLDTAIPLKSSIIPKYLEGIFLEDALQFTQICMKDSRDLSQADRKKLLKTVEKTRAKKIIITHGTYTIPDTARYITANVKREDQVIIFTGSFTPIDGFTNSDEPFNLGYSFAEMKHLKPGIYVCMHGKIFTPEELAKDISAGKFFSIFNEPRST